jgi:enoyl-CoA hydratase/carnithine racemase
VARFLLRSRGHEHSGSLTKLGLGSRPTPPTRVGLRYTVRVGEWKSHSGLITVEHEGSVAVVRFDRAAKLNALNEPMLEDTARALAWLGTGDEDEAIVVTGNGRAFSAGDDLPATESLDRSGFEHLLSRFQELTRAVLRSSVPVVAALNGIAVGGAAEFTLACDARVGYPGSDYLFPENDVGMTISNGATYLLPRLIGSRALPLILDARRVDGTEAYRLGLIDHFVDSVNQVLPKAIEIATRWVERGLATPFHLKMLRPPIEEVEAAIERENRIGAEAWDAGTPNAGVKRFLEEQRARKKA